MSDTRDIRDTSNVSTHAFGIVDDKDDSLLTIVDTTGSTNDDARELALAGAPHGTAVAARLQTAGRGRRGHAWSATGGSVCLSVVLRPPVPMSYYVAVPTVCMMGALRALRQATGLGTRLGLKWPNDVVGNAEAFDGSPWRSDGGKIAGLLVEAGHADGKAFAIAGLGVNVHVSSVQAARQAQATADPTTLSPHALPALCLEDLVADASVLPTFDELAVAIHREILMAMGDWTARLQAGLGKEGPLACVLSDYEALVPAIGHEVRAITPAGNEVARGLLVGFDPWGRARLHTTGGEELKFASEQVSLRMTGRI